MRTISLLTTFILLLFIGFFLQQEPTFSAPKKQCWYSYAADCGYDEPSYCTDGKCTLSGGLTATKVAIGDNLTKKTLSEFIKDIVTYFLGFVTLIAIIYIIYAGFQLMTGAGDEEKNKKAKNIILYVAGGIIIMWLAYSIVAFITNAIGTSAYNTHGGKYVWSIIPIASANTYSETDNDTFREYQNRLRIAIQDLESELKINKGVNTASIQNIKNLLQGAYDRLPDFGEAGTHNDSMKRAVDRDLELAIKSPNSTSQVGAAISSVASFLSSARIDSIQGSINATPGEGNAPVTVSFEANGIRDPSGATPDQMSYIWWMRENGGVRRELGRGKSLVYTFSQEGTYTVFLDVISGSRNSKKRVDVLPLSTSKTIDVKSRLGEVTLLVNGVNVSNLDSLKINPAIGKMGIIFDATASRATGGNINKTEWKFGNGNTMTYNGAPIIERQIFSNNGNYDVSLTLSTNNGQTFTKNLRLIVRNPSAVIQTEKVVGTIGEEMAFSSLSYFTNTANVEYSWQIQDDNNKRIINNLPGNSLRYTFDKIGTYIITLNARSPNGEIDTDSRRITIESKKPIINLEQPKVISSEFPNRFIFDATKSYDPDTMSRKGLTYSWYLDGERVELKNTTQDGGKGEITFDKIGTHTIGLTLSNIYGKIATEEKRFDVTSLLSVNMLVTPRVGPIGTPLNFIAQSENASFFEWNMGDGSPTISGDKKIVQHTYTKAGVYEVTLKVTNSTSTESNQIKRKVYVTNAGSPFALMSISNQSNSAYYDPSACEGSGATIINRSEVTNFDGSKSINIDGGTSSLTYTWNYFGKVKTTASLSEKFRDIGCFPVRLTVRSNTNGATHTSTEYIAIKNIAPEITSISTHVDTTKKDSQKVLVRVTANGATDPDGVITSYIWYYTTESDKDPQNIQITQSPEITFVLPNITEKYYFGVIIEDNNGAKTNSIENGSEQVPLILDNQNSNIFMPLITMNVPKNTVLVGENIKLYVEAKTIVGTNITKTSEYAWDFDGDGRFDTKTTNPTINHIYKNSGSYSVKVRVTNNGVSNIKYTTIHVKNPLKASASGYILPNGKIYIMDTSVGAYDATKWKIGGEEYNTPDSIIIEAPNIDLENSSEPIGTITVSLGDADISIYSIERSSLIQLTRSDIIHYQSSLGSTDDTIYIQSPADGLNLSLLANDADNYKIDTDIRIDSDLDGIPDNDIDNSDHPSYTDGSIYTIHNFGERKNREQIIRISIVKNGVEKSKDIKLIFEFIPEGSTLSGENNLSDLGLSISEFDKTQLEELVEIIRTTDGADRIILMQEYNILIENWSDTFSKAKSLIDIQEVVDRSTLSEDLKTKITTIIDNLLVGDATSTDEIFIASKLIQDLIPTSSKNRDIIIEKLAKITSHPTNLESNKVLGKDILELVKYDDTIEDVYKIHIRTQLLIIMSGGQSSVSEDPSESGTASGLGGILGLLSGVVWVFLYIIGGIILVICGGYIFYVIGRKNEDIGFQDFLIDAVFHTKKPVPNTPSESSDTAKIIIDTPPVISDITTDSNTKVIDPLLVYTSNPDITPTPDSQTPPALDPLGAQDSIDQTLPDNTASTIPSWLQVPTSDNTSIDTAKDSLQDSLDNATDTPIAVSNDTQPIAQDALEKNDDSAIITGSDENTRSEDIPTNTLPTTEPQDPSTEDLSEGSLPDWLIDSLNSHTTESANTTADDQSAKVTETKSTPKKKRKKDIVDTPDATTAKDNNTKSDDIPDWLK